MAGSQKSRKNISLGEEEKKAILDKVASSDKPIAEALRELGISRSTYYSWLSRYQSGGEEGLKDKRGPQAPGDVALPEEPAAPEVPEISAPAPTEKNAESSADAASAVKPEPKPQIKKEELRVSSSEAVPSGGKPMTSRKSTNFSLAATLAIIFVIAGLIVSLCMWNSSKYFIAQDGSEITLWKGKFALLGKQKVEDFAPINVGAIQLNPITDKTYYGEWAAVNALFGYMLERADEALNGANGANYAEANRFLALAESVAYKGEQKSALNNRYARLYYTLAKKKVTQSEQQLIAMYEDSIDVLERARDMGLYSSSVVDQEIDVLKSKLDELRQWNTNFSGSYLSTKGKETAAVKPAEEKPPVAVIVVEEVDSSAKEKAAMAAKEKTAKKEAIKKEEKELLKELLKEPKQAPVVEPAKPVAEEAAKPVEEALTAAPTLPQTSEGAIKAEEPAAPEAVQKAEESAPEKTELKFEAVPQKDEPAKQENAPK